MPIKGLTDRETLNPQLPRLGKLRKGGEKKGNKPGADLDHFRFTSERPEVEKAFHDAYGREPRQVNAVLYHDTMDEAFATWIECWDASGLVFRSDGEHWIIWREGDTYKRGHKPHKDHEDQVEIGRLEFLVPELLRAGHVGTVTLETHSNHDLRNIAQVLMVAEKERGHLRGAPFVIRRVEREISVPGWGDRAGKRSKATKWLVELETPAELFRGYLQKAADLPELEAGVDHNTGEVIDAEPPREIEDERTPLERAENTRTPKGVRLGDMSSDELLRVSAWGEKHPDNQVARELRAAAERIIAARLDAEDDDTADRAMIVRSSIRAAVGDDDGEQASQKQRGAVAGCLDALLPERYDKAATDRLRHQITSFLVGKKSSSDLTKREASALIDWATVENGWDADPQAQKDAMAILNKLGEDAGQERLEI